MVHTPKQVLVVRTVRMAKARILELAKALRHVSSVNPAEPCMQQVEQALIPIALNPLLYLRTLEMVVMELALTTNLQRGALALLLFVMQGGRHNGKVNGTYRKRRSYQCFVVFKSRA